LSAGIVPSTSSRSSLPLQEVELLRAFAVEAVALAQEHVAMPVEGQARAEIGAARQRVRFAIDDVHVRQGPIAERRVGSRQRRGAARRRLDESEPDELAAREIRCEDHVQQSGLSLRQHRGHAGQRRRDFALRGNAAELAAAFRDQEPAARQQSDGPGMVEAGGDGVDAHAACIGACVRSTGLGCIGGGPRVGVRSRIATRQDGSEQDEGKQAMHQRYPAAWSSNSSA
jgi:hypothetical protein